MHLPIAYPVRVGRSGKRAGIFRKFGGSFLKMGTARYAGGMPIDQQVLTNTKAERIRRIAELTNRKHRQKAGGSSSKGRSAFARRSHGSRRSFRMSMCAPMVRNRIPPIASATLGKLAGEAMGERIHVHKMTQEVEHRVSHDAQGCLRLPT